VYVPPLFKEDRIDVLHDAIRRTGLATLVTLSQDGLIASHVPMLLDTEPAPYGTLIGHLARPNPQARGGIGEALSAHRLDGASLVSRITGILGALQICNTALECAAGAWPVPGQNEELR